jgi:hypothetical protein
MYILESDIAEVLKTEDFNMIADVISALIKYPVILKITKKE